MSVRYLIPHAAPIPTPRDFPLPRLATTLRDLSAAECDRRAGVLRHELDTLKAARRVAQGRHDYAAAHDIDGKVFRVRQAWGLLEDARRYQFGARGVAS